MIFKNSSKMIITICVTLFLSLLALHLVLHYNKARRLISKIPGPTPLPFFGNMLMLNSATKNYTIWNILGDVLDKYYPIVRMNSFIANMVLLRHPEDIKILSSCKKNIEKAEIAYGVLRNFGNNGLILSGGSKWQQRRKMLNPAFNPELLKLYVEFTNEHVERFLKNIKTQNHDLVIPDLVDVMNKLAMEIICAAVMGSDSNICACKEAEDMGKRFRQVTKVAFYRATRPYLRDWMMRFSSTGRTAQHAYNDLSKFTEKVIQKRREYHEKTGYRHLQNKADDDDVFKSQRKRLAIVDLLLAVERDGLIDKLGIIEEVMTIILAGYETTGIALSFALMLLAENPEAQKLARDEVTEVMEKTGGLLTIADLTELNYLDRCVKETLRLFPSAPFVGRHTTHEIKLSNYNIPVGIEVGMFFSSLHRDSNYWPNPEKFDPDRFLPENVEKRHPFAYMPFSAGPRSCLGYKFAMLEMKAVVARILFNFYLDTLESTADVKFELHFALNPTAPCRIRLTKIDRN